jgi:hypothetical protein
MNLCRGGCGTERLRSKSVEDTGSKPDGEGLYFTLHLLGTVRYDLVR